MEHATELITPYLQDMYVLCEIFFARWYFTVVAKLYRERRHAFETTFHCTSFMVL